VPDFVAGADRDAPFGGAPAARFDIQPIDL
jgi:hypothetical protein